MKVFCISGKAQHGKDTTAAFFKDALEADGYSVLIVHYGDLLKYVCKTFFGWNGEKDEYGRSLLQRVGTDIIRNKNPDYWVGFVRDMLMFFDGEWDYVLIPDCRFPNEVDEMKKTGMDVVHLRVFRQGFVSPLTPEQQAHPSETALDNTIPDYYINNFGTLNDLRNTISAWLADVNGHHQICIEEL